jgi:predicted kinase
MSETSTGSRPDADQAEPGPVVYLLCGLTGSGKTTFAQRMQAEGVVRLSVDEEVFARHGRYGVDYPENRYFELERPVIEEVRERLVALVRAGQSVILDQGLWRRADRDSCKRLVEEHGGRWRLLYFKVSRATLLERLAERNQRGDANALAVTAEALDDFIARFDEPVGEGEEVVGPHAVVIS